MADVPKSGIPAFSAWFAQVSDAISNSFRSIGQNGALEVSHSSIPEVSVGGESSEVVSCVDSGQNVRDVNGSEVDVSSMNPQEKIEALQAQLAMRGLGSEFDSSHTGERLTPIGEELDEVESRRSLASWCSNSGKIENLFRLSASLRKMVLLRRFDGAF